MRILYATSLCLALIFIGGCTEGVENARTSPPSTTGGTIKVDIDTDSNGEERQETRIERREERREKLRERIDSVDVDVNRGEVDVKVD